MYQKVVVVMGLRMTVPGMVRSTQVRSFNSLSQVLLANPQPNVRPSFSFRKKAKVYVPKGPIVKNLVAPNAWDLEALPSVTLPPLDQSNANLNNVNAIFSLPTPSKLKLMKLIPKGILDLFETARETGLLFRRATLELLNYTLANSEKSTYPLIIDGVRDSGKSVLLLQIVSQLMPRGWLVIYLPEIRVFVNGSKPYQRSPTSKLFIQPEVASQVLASVLALNDELLKEIAIDHAIKVGKQTLPAGANLAQLVTLGSTSVAVSQTCLENFFTVVSQQTSVPVLLAMDGVNILYGYSDYYDTDSRRLRNVELAIVRLLADFVQKRRRLQRGLVLGVTSWIDGAYTSTAFGPKKFDVCKGIHRASLRSGSTFDRYYLDLYTKEEARALADYYFRASILYQELTPQNFEKKYAITNGNPGMFYRACARIF